LMPCFVSAPRVVSDDHGFLWVDALSEQSGRCTRKRSASRSIESLWNAMSSMMKQVPLGESRTEKRTRSFYPSTLRLCTPVTYALFETIAAMARVRLQDPFRCRRKTVEPHGAYHAGGIVLQWDASAWISTKSIGFVFRTVLSLFGAKSPGNSRHELLNRSSTD